MSIQMNLAAALGAPRDTRRYRLCGFSVECDAVLPLLPAFAEHGPTAAVAAPASGGAPLEAQGPWRHSVEGPVAGRQRRVSLSIDQQGLRIGIESVAQYALDATASNIHLEHVYEDIDPATLQEATLGVPLILSLALRECWMLHASSVRTGDGVVALAGPAGSGKSTLARHLDAVDVATRVGDDTLGLGLDAGALAARPAYPQLKLPPCGQPALGSAPVGAVVFLRPAPATGELRITKLGRPRGLLALVRHTVATRLFPRELLRRHLRFCGDAADTVPMFEAFYPRSPAALTGLGDWVEQRSWQDAGAGGRP